MGGNPVDSRDAMKPPLGAVAIRIAPKGAVHRAWPGRTDNQTRPNGGCPGRTGGPHLYLREGMWDGRDVVPGPWVRESTTAYSRAGPSGYGYLWWIDAWPGVSVRSYSARGALGKYIIVIPESLSGNRSHDFNILRSSSKPTAAKVRVKSRTFRPHGRNCLCYQCRDSGQTLSAIWSSCI